MPELPEVETIVRDLRRKIVGKTFARVSLLDWPRSIASPSAEQFGQEIEGKAITEVRRRAKFIIIGLSGGAHLVVHLKMTGSLLFREASDPPDRYTRVALDLEDGSQLRFTDLRKFGRLYLLDSIGLEGLVESLGPEPLEPDFTEERFRDLIAGRRGRLKPLLLNQAFVAGIGNIYADEALFRAKLHPLRTVETLSEEEIRRLYEAIREVLGEGVSGRGTTFDSYRDAEGRKGRHQEKLRVFRRTGQRCLACPGTVRRIVVGGRGTHYCPDCQPLGSG